jgi:hypothetical protein
VAKRRGRPQAAHQDLNYQKKRIKNGKWGISCGNGPFADFHFVSRHEEKREAGGQGEFSVGLAARRDPSPMSRHNQQLSVEEGCSLLGGTHAMKSVNVAYIFLKVFRLALTWTFPRLI